MDLLVRGIILGLTLSVLTGPILFMLVQTGVERGFRAGFSSALGVWMSDFAYITFLFWGLRTFKEMSKGDDFVFWVGMTGGLILVAFGIGTLIIKPQPKPAHLPIKAQAKSYLGLWLVGFLINTLNPFTAFFWLGIVSSVLHADALVWEETYPFFAGLMGTLILTDTLKVFFAKRIKPYLKERYISRVKRVAGIILILFGLGLMMRVYFNS